MCLFRNISLCVMLLEAPPFCLKLYKLCVCVCKHCNTNNPLRLKVTKQPFFFFLTSYDSLPSTNLPLSSCFIFRFIFQTLWTASLLETNQQIDLINENQWERSESRDHLLLDTMHVCQLPTKSGERKAMDYLPPYQHRFKRRR